MIKRVLSIGLLFLSLLPTGLFAQTPMVAYYLNSSGKVTSVKDSAELILVISPPDTSANKNLFPITCYYKNGKVSFATTSLTHDLPLSFEGQYVSFFENGKRKMMGTYKSGMLAGNVTSFFPNGKLYNIKTYSGEKILLKQCNDSTGNILTRNQNGKWIEYTPDFSAIQTTGVLSQGEKDGTWIESTDSVHYISAYKKGELWYSSILYRYKDETGKLSNFDTDPKFPGGSEAFGSFVKASVNNSMVINAKNQKHRAVVAFVVEQNGYIDNIRILISLDEQHDTEALRIMQLSPNWIPGIKDGKAVAGQFSAPIDFSF